MLMNLQNNFATMQQRSDQTDANITHLNDLINTRLSPPLEEEGEDDEDDQEQPIMVPDPNNPGRLIVQHNPRVLRVPAVNPNLAGNVPVANPNIAAFTAKMAQLEESIAKAEKVKAGGIDLDRFYLYPNARLPEKFKMLDLAKFDGSGDPRTHLYSYHAAMKLLSVEPEAMSQLFPQTFSDPAFHWFLSLDIAKRRTWEDIGAAFISQYSYNSQLKMTIRELESTKMEAKETFADFVKRWRAKAALMTDRPSEKDQLRIISRNLQPDYAKHLVLAQASANFETFFDSSLAIEDALQSGILSRGESSNPPKAKPRAYPGNTNALFGGGTYSNTAISGTNSTSSSTANYISDVNQVQTPQNNRARGQPRSFFAMEAPLSSVLEKLVKSGHLKPLDPMPLPKNPPANFKANLYCAYHQGAGHLTDSCFRLRHAIQDLIDEGTLQAPPPPSQKPNILSNSLPNHKVVPILAKYLSAPLKLIPTLPHLTPLAI
ncbi:hypothetical protein RHMOL_Rhmol02G0200500 [Rhododendron molle]|uniref:Uncharacterized protein n=1 Tax=Rhododendron molle TaxID=49168 RepID=A0ACC0PS74_RHOML|nr:hypothetical protein RHMOL_Rhmol02G0200500 [Rhododendron molle]